MAGIKAALLSHQPHLFDQWHLAPRQPLPQRAQAFIDQTLHAWKGKTIDDGEMRFKYEGVPYLPAEVEQARLVAKNNNGLAFLSDGLLNMYPDATFFALVRHPLPLYESHKRRGISQTVDQFRDRYVRIAQRMLNDAARFDNYHLVRFEDILSDPIKIMRLCYNKAGLDFEKVDKVRFKAKPHFQESGSHNTAYEEGQHYWFEKDEVFRMLEPRINGFQLERLDSFEQEMLQKGLEIVLPLLGYDTVQKV